MVHDFCLIKEKNISKSGANPKNTPHHKSCVNSVSESCGWKIFIKEYAARYPPAICPEGSIRI